MTAPDGGPEEGEMVTGLVIPVPDEGMVVLVLREGDGYAFMPVPRELLEDTESVYEVVREAIGRCEQFIAQTMKGESGNGTVPDGRT